MDNVHLSRAVHYCPYAGSVCRRLTAMLAGELRGPDVLIN